MLNKTIVYSYDAGRNILSKTEYPYTTSTTFGTAINTIAYTYGDATWKDKLTSYNGNAITYDNAGNTLTYNGYTFSWEAGRQLSAISGNGKNISYKYNNYGCRTEKTVHGITSKYYLDGDKVVLENTGNGSIYYSYDADDKLVSMTLNGTEYFYIRNGQGDITGLIDTVGTQVVSYTYDSWGKLVSIEGSLKDTVGLQNPYRYRGYRYDTETGFYSLQSRYYDPEIGRFINADAPEILGLSAGNVLGANLFAYCNNNPINYSDPSGYFTPANVIGAVIGLIGGAVIGTALANYFKLGWPWKGLVIGSVSAALTVVGWFAGPTVYAAVKPLVMKAIAACTVFFNRAQEWILKALGLSQTWINQALRLIDAKTVRFSQTVINHLNGDRPVPIQTLIDAIKSGRAVPDPQCMANRVMYYCKVWVNGKPY